MVHRTSTKALLLSFMKNLSAAVDNTVVMVLAGGEGERLYPLTRDRAKPAVPFAGNLRLIDFSLSNCLNSGLRRVHVLTQYKSDSLSRHIRLGWDIFNPELGEYIEVNPPQLRLASTWYQGTADAIYQNIYTLQHEKPRYVLILSGDHVYGMDYSRLIAHHIGNEACLTVACRPMPAGHAAHLGTVTTDAQGKIEKFEEKPQQPATIELPGAFPPEAGEFALCSMGVYVFNTDALVRRVIEDSKHHTTHDFGRDVIPAMIDAGDRIMAFRFSKAEKGRLPYWKDIGTLDAYLQANIEVATGRPECPLTEPLALYEETWPFRSYMSSAPPLNILCNQDDFAAGLPTRICNSLVSNGVVIRDAMVSRSVIGSGVHIGSGSIVEQSVIMPGVKIGRNVEIRRAIIDKNNTIPDGNRIGLERDRDAHYFTISDGGVVAVPKNMPLFNDSR